MAAQSSAAIRSMVIPLDQEMLLLPGSMVAEVVLYSEPEPPATACAPAWLLGFVPWRGHQLALVSLETFINKQHQPAPLSSRRVAVIKTLDSTLGFPFYGILSRQMPRLVSVEADAVVPLPADAAQPRPRVAAEVLLNGERMMIPDIAALEKGLWAVLPT